MQVESIDKFIAGLCNIPQDQFSVGTVYDYVKTHQVEKATLEPYLFFKEGDYTRNLIFKNELFELLALCWDCGQSSRIHNHCEQNCWMAVPIGRLQVQNFRVIEQDDRTGYCKLEAAEAFDIHSLSPTEVDPAEPVHQVLNLPEFNERAVSLHIYSRPYESCLVYSLAKHTCHEVRLAYTSEYGNLCSDASLKVR